MTNIVDVSRALARVVASVEKGVVAVHGGRSDTSSGVAWGRDLVVTLAQSLERDQGIEVTAAGGRFPASLVGADPSSGVAVLRVDAELAPFELADGAALRVGELVLALGRTARGPGARLGIVSRLGAEWQLPGGARFERYIESDASPAPGLTGSALVTVSGALIGLNSTGIARGALVSLPAPSVGRIVDALVTHGRVRRARLGVAVERVGLPRAVADRLGRRRGLVVVTVVEGSPAERGGLLLGDVVLAIDEKPTERVDDLYAALDENAIGREVAADILRAGQNQRLLLEPEAR
jgi:S1-C subfamily serine protease